MSRLVTIFCGFILLLGLTWVCVQRKGSAIAQSLSQGITEQLESSGTPGIEVVVDGRDVSLRGHVRSQAMAEQIKSQARVRGVRQVTEHFTIVPLKVLDLEVEAWKLGERILLRGELPDSAARTRIITTAEKAFGAPNVMDQLSIREAEPMPKMEAALDSVLRRFPRIHGAWAKVDGRELRVEGRLADAEQRRRIAEQIRAELPGDFRVALDLGSPWEPNDLRGLARRDGDSLILAGVVADPDTWELLDQRARASFGEANVQNRLRIAELPPTFPLGRCLADSFPLLKELNSGQTVSTPGQTLVSGLALHASSLETMTVSLRENLPDECSLSTDLAVLIDSSTCEDKIRLLLAGEKIQFQSGSDSIHQDSSELLQRIASTLRQCPGGNLTIEGHTDDRGDEGLNLNLSQGRAEAVRNRLIQLGLPPGKATALGFGEGHPIADNQSEEGRAKNRRIEFRIAGD